MTDLGDLERRLWSAADELRANSSLSPTEYRGPVLGLIFLAFAEHRFDEVTAGAGGEGDRAAGPSRRRLPRPGRAVRARDRALSWLVDLPEGENLGANIDLAMDAIELE